MPTESASSSRCGVAWARKQVRDLAVAVNVPPGDARRLADALVTADEQGIPTHGISRLNVYLRRIQAGLINPRAKLSVLRQRGGVLVLDANHGLGQVQALKALDRLVPLARKHGVAVATIRNSQHFGALSYYCNQAAAQDMILIASTNGEPAMSPEGGCQAFFGTNPLAASFPTGRGGPVKIDFATSIVARGKIIAAQKRGQSIPSGGHKGYALALMLEVLSGVLSGAAIGPAVGSMYTDMNRRQGVGHFFCLLDIAAFMEVSEFKQRIDRTIDGIKACRKRPGVSEILIPGESSHRQAKQNRLQGISVDESTRSEIKQLCKDLGVEFRLGPVARSRSAIARRRPLSRVTAPVYRGAKSHSNFRGLTHQAHGRPR